MANSKLVDVVVKSPNHSGKRKNAVTRITPHCVVGQLTAEGIGSIFKSPSREASSNYGIGKDGRIGLYVDEVNRSWCSSSRDNDNRAITIECASDTKSPYAMKSAVYNSLVDLCADICKRYKKKKLLWLGSKEKTLSYTPKSDEMILTVHRWFAAKACPGDWLMSRMSNLARDVTRKIGETGRMYRVQVGAYIKEENANKMRDRLRKDGYNSYVVKRGDLYRVQVGAFTKKSNAVALQKKLKKSGYDPIIV